MVEEVTLNNEGEIEQKKEGKEKLLDKIFNKKKEEPTTNPVKEITKTEFETMKKIVFQNITYVEAKAFSDAKTELLIEALIQENKNLKEKINSYDEILSKIKQ